MPILILLILGFVQGIGEFLPISSSGHLVLLSKIFGVEDSLFVSIILHIATLLALIVVMRKEIWQIIRNPFSSLGISIVLSTIFTCLVAILIMPFLTASFEGIVLPVTFTASAILLLLTRKQTKDGGEINYKRAIFIGLAQGLAIFPGLSRSGTTIATGILSGGKREDSAKFSFLISIPVILGSLFFELIKIFTTHEQISVNWVGLVLAFLVAFIVGIISIKFMLKMTEKLNFKFFAIYLIVMAIISTIVLIIM